MDIERAIEFLVKQSAATDAKLAAFHDDTKRQLARSERRHDNTARLLKDGFRLMREIVRMQKETRAEMKKHRAEVQAEMKDIRALHRDTEAKLNRFLGHGPKNGKNGAH